MSKVKAGGKARQHAQRPGKRLGVKVFGGQSVKNGAIIVRQRGANFHPADGTSMGKDFTIYATIDGLVNFSKRQARNFVQVVANKKVKT